MLEELRQARRKTVGTKQSLKAVESGKAKTVFVAADAEEHVLRSLRKACEESGVPVVSAASMAELGKACGIEIGAAAAVITEE